ncbi:MAG TPA: hypothetical protein VEG63_06630 [Candidatus Acidoferrales bacterium]|nr:hypothetical protein [Candidatus Acidoferrales bacterium]
MTVMPLSALRKLGLGVLVATLGAGIPAFAQSGSTNSSQSLGAAQQPSSNQNDWQRFSSGGSNQNATAPHATTAPGPSPTMATPVQENQDPNAQAAPQVDSQNAQQDAQQNVPTNPPAGATSIAPTANPQEEASAWKLIIPAGTYLTVRINEALSSDRNQEGDAFTATLAQPVIVNGVVVARQGQTVGGRVAEAKKAGRVSGVSRLKLELTGLTLADGQEIPIQSQLMTENGQTSKGRDAAAIAGTTAFGAAVGAAAAWGTGAAIGAGAGLVASTIGVLVTRGRPTILYPETQLTFQTSAPATVDTERSPQSFRVANADDYSEAPSRAAVNHPPRGPYCGPYGCPAPYYAYGYPYPYPYYAYYGPYYYPYPYFWGPSFGFFYGRGYYGGFRGGFHR